MYTRITRSGGRSYLQIVEGFRTEAGVRQRVLACVFRRSSVRDSGDPRYVIPEILGT